MFLKVINKWLRFIHYKPKVWKQICHCKARYNFWQINRHDMQIIFDVVFTLNKRELFFFLNPYLIQWMWDQYKINRKKNLTIHLEGRIIKFIFPH